MDGTLSCNDVRISASKSYLSAPESDGGRARVRGIVADLHISPCKKGLRCAGNILRIFTQDNDLTSHQMEGALEVYPSF